VNLVILRDAKADGTDIGPREGIGNTHARKHFLQPASEALPGAMPGRFRRQVLGVRILPSEMPDVGQAL